MLAECGRDFMSSNLTSLYLSQSEIEDDPMGMLGKLPCLTSLSLWSSSFVGEEMTCPSLSFPQLKKLELFGLPNLKEWRVEEGAMPLLSELEIGWCSRLEMLPEGLSGISTLQKITISEMPELAERVSESGEESYGHVGKASLLEEFVFMAVIICRGGDDVSITQFSSTQEA